MTNQLYFSPDGKQAIITGPGKVTFSRSDGHTDCVTNYVAPNGSGNLAAFVGSPDVHVITLDPSGQIAISATGNNNGNAPDFVSLCANQNPSEPGHSAYEFHFGSCGSGGAYWLTVDVLVSDSGDPGPGE